MERLTYMNGGKWCIRMGDTEYSGEKVDRISAYEDLLDGCDIDRLLELAEADKDGRIKIEPKARLCPKCGKHSVFPRIDWKYYYCFSCKTQFSEKEYLAAIKEDKNG